MPAKRVREFTAAADRQSKVELKVLIGESPLARKCMPVGSFHESLPLDTPPLAAGRKAGLRTDCQNGHRNGRGKGFVVSWGA